MERKKNSDVVKNLYLIFFLIPALCPFSFYAGGRVFVFNGTWTLANQLLLKIARYISFFLCIKKRRRRRSKNKPKSSFFTRIITSLWPLERRAPTPTTILLGIRFEPATKTCETKPVPTFLTETNSTSWSRNYKLNKDR